MFQRSPGEGDSWRRVIKIGGSSVLSPPLLFAEAGPVSRW
jgi:hypothetical protein